MTGQTWNKGKTYEIKQKRPLSEILVEHSIFNTNHLKQRLFKEGVKEKCCECCGLKMWQGHPIALELHHINGIKDDLRIENL